MQQGIEPRINVATNKLDELGEFIKLDSTLYTDRSSWEALFHQVKGRSNFSQDLLHLDHPAARLLSTYARTGVPVLLTTAPWSLEKKDAAIARGNHPSVQAFSEFIREEMLDMRKKGVFVILPYHLIRDHPALRISPLGCVPQRERRPRIINDYTFSDVNPASHKLAPDSAMQWGRTLHRVLWFIFNADRRHGPVLLSKTDLSDGFYQIPLTPTGALKLAVPFESTDQEPLVAIPTRLPMGWTQSPPAFSATTETIADLANAYLEADCFIPGPHPLEAAASTPVGLDDPTAADVYPIQESGPIRPALAYVDVYVDDFVKLAQGWANALRVRRHTYHAIDSVFRPNDSSDPGHRKEPISVKKLKKGDDHWSTRKTILGWDIDTRAMTVSLPPHRQQRLLDLLRTMVRRKRTSIKEWHKLLGELRSMSMAVPGSDGCFSFLQEALKPNLQRIKISPAVRDQLLDFLWVAESVVSRPTHIAEIVPTPELYQGTVDASGLGMGGVWFPPVAPSPLTIRPPREQLLSQPCLWRERFPEHVTKQLISYSNPHGTITNSDLELAGTIAHDDVLAHAVPVTHVSTRTFTDNTPAMSWRTKGNATTKGPAAYLLQLSALHRRHHRYRNYCNFLPGHLNTLADKCSRLWNLNDAELLTHFNTHYPQETSWRLLHLRPEMRSALISALHRKRSRPESYLPAIARQRKHGRSGVRFAPTTMSTPTFRRWPTLSHCYKSSASAGATVASLPVESPTGLVPWRMQSGLSARNFPHWGP